MNLLFTPYFLKFKRPFSIAHGVRDSTKVVFTQLEHQGVFGYGEASMPPYTGEDHESVLSFLSKAKKIMLNFSPVDSIDTILSKIDKIDFGNTAAKASIDIALHDLAGKIRNESCQKMLNGGREKSFITAYTISIDNPKGLKERIEEGKEYALFKVKLGTADDQRIILEIRKHTSSPIIVDVNEGWKDKHFALDMIHWLHEKNVLLAEQPMPRELVKEISWLTERSPIPVIADEAIKRILDIEKLRGVYSGINIKLMKCTGLYEARKMIEVARQYEMKVMLGCMSESSCGVSAAAQIASLVDWVDLDGPLLIQEDFFNGVQFSEGKIKLNNLPGIGVSLKSNDLFQIKKPD